MATNYLKYINSTGTHYISNSGSDERGRISGGEAGDQTGGEWKLRSWYNRPWTVVLRYPDTQVRETIAKLGIDAALNNKIGYDQYQRTTYWKQLAANNYSASAITAACESDCTAGVTSNAKAAGYIHNIPALKNLSTSIYSGNMRSNFVKAGFKALTDNKYLTGYSYLLPGDILLYEGHHAATNITKGKNAVESHITVPDTTSYVVGERSLQNGDVGSDVEELQRLLIEAGYSCGSYGIDGDFGDATEMAVRKFQTDHNLTVDGIVGAQTLAALKSNATVIAAKGVKIVGGDCYIRDAANTKGNILGVAKEKSNYEYDGETASNGWLSIKYNGKIAWVSGKYGKLIN